MWFKNLRLYCLNQAFSLSQEELEKQLAEFHFAPCSSYEKTRMGWVPPIPQAATAPAGEVVGDDEAGQAADSEEATVDEGVLEGPLLTHVVGDYIMLCAQTQDRLLPASVVREATEEKVAELEERQARKIYRKEKKQIQEDMFAQLLPRAFTRNQRTYAYLAPKDNLLVVDAASAPKAEEFVNLLRDTLGSFPVSLPDSVRSPADVMTHWLRKHKATDNFFLEEDCELYNPLDGSNVVRCKGQDLESEEISAHLEAGKQVKSLGVSWNSLLSCIIHDDLSIKRLRFEEMREESDSFAEESAAQKFDQEFALMSMELSNFFKALFTAFGGLAPPKSKD
jgi:recombination associated protein RdgC